MEITKSIQYHVTISDETMGVIMEALRDYSLKCQVRLELRVPHDAGQPDLSQVQKKQNAAVEFLHAVEAIEAASNRPQYMGPQFMGQNQLPISCPKCKITGARSLMPHNFPDGSPCDGWKQVAVKKAEGIEDAAS